MVRVRAGGDRRVNVDIARGAWRLTNPTAARQRQPRKTLPGTDFRNLRQQLPYLPPLGGLGGRFRAAIPL